MTPVQHARLEQALIDLSRAVDGSGLRININPHGISQKAIRSRLHELMAMGLPRGPSGVVFLGQRGEEAWLTNLALLANALLALCEVEGGSDLNHVLQARINAV